MSLSLLRNGALIDGTGRTPVRDGAVLIEDRHIRAAGTASTVHAPDGDVRVIDVQGGWILPGFIDAHVHVMGEGMNLEAMLTTPFSLTFFKAAGYLRQTIEAGITTVRDAGGADLGVKQAVDDGLVVGPRLQISVTPLTTTGGHGDGWLPSGYSLNLSYPGRPDGRCDGVEAVRAKVREVLQAGADVIKVFATGGVISPTSHPESSEFTPEELAVMVQEGAQRRGVKVMAHAQGTAGIKNAVRAGVHSIEHGIFLDDEAIELMLEHGTYLVPTLVAPLGILAAAETAGNVPEYALRKVRDVMDAHKVSVARAYRAGVTVAMGTDSGVAPHGTNLRELRQMCDIGMTPMEAIVASTKVGAECLGWEDRVGTLVPGRLADVVVVRKDPLEDIRSLEDPDDIVLVIKDGRIVKDSRHPEGKR